MMLIKGFLLPKRVGYKIKWKLCCTMKSVDRTYEGHVERSIDTCHIKLVLEGNIYLSLLYVYHQWFNN